MLKCNYKRKTILVKVVGLHSSPKAMLALHGGQWVIGKITPTEKGFELAQQFHQELIFTSSFILFVYIYIFIGREGY
jgi:hypothetical protein